MNILITNHWFKRYGGSETFTYTLGKALLRAGHNVTLYTRVPGALSKRMEQEGIPLLKDKTQRFDLVLANHNTCVLDVYGLGPIIQTCHGTVPKLEQPSKLANTYVAISEEVQWYLETKYNYKSTLIRNGVDCNRFSPTKQLNPKIQRVLSLAHSDHANTVIKKACTIIGAELITINKYVDGVFEIETLINQSDLVVTLGRGAYESFACGRPVVVFDSRHYMQTCGDGYVLQAVIDDIVKTNCSGRWLNHEYTAQELVDELSYYDPEDGSFLRAYALEHFNIDKQVEKYLQTIN